MNAPVRIPGEAVPMGDNAPPAEPTPFDISQTEISDLYAEAKHFLDGDPITTQAMANAVGSLMAKLREAGNRADERRTEEKRPHDEAAAEVQSRYAPLIAGLKSKVKGQQGKAVLALDACNKALAPFLAAQDAEKRRVEAEAREAARVAAEAAQAAFQASRVDDLAAREEAERLATVAKTAEATARKAENDRATVKGGARAIGMRKTYAAKVTDLRAFSRWVWTHREHELAGMMQTLADSLCSNGIHDLPGVTITEGVRAQ